MCAANRAILWQATKPLVLVFALSLVALSELACNGSRDRLTYSSTTNTNQGDEVFPDTPTGKQLKGHLHTAVGVGEDAEESHQRSLESLRKNPNAIKAIIDAYVKTPQHLYFQRQLLVETLKEMRSEQALDSLHRIVAEPIPDEKFTKEGAEYSTREEEIIIRAIAVEGISLLASEGNTADQLLSKHINHDDLTVRQLAVRGYLAAAGRETRAKRAVSLKILLPVADHWLITVETTRITSVPHPDMPENFDLNSLKNQSSLPPNVKE